MLGMRERFRTRVGARMVWISMIPSVLFEDRWLRFDSAAGSPTLVVWVWFVAAAKSNCRGLRRWRVGALYRLGGGRGVVICSLLSLPLWMARHSFDPFEPLSTARRKGPFALTVRSSMMVGREASDREAS